MCFSLLVSSLVFFLSWSFFAIFAGVFFSVLSWCFVFADVFLHGRFFFAGGFLHVFLCWHFFSAGVFSLQVFFSAGGFILCWCFFSAGDFNFPDILTMGTPKNVAGSSICFTILTCKRASSHSAVQFLLIAFLQTRPLDEPTFLTIWEHLIWEHKPPQKQSISRDQSRTHILDLLSFHCDCNKKGLLDHFRFCSRTFPREYWRCWSQGSHNSKQKKTCDLEQVSACCFSL